MNIPAREASVIRRRASPKPTMQPRPSTRRQPTTSGATSIHRGGCVSAIGDGPSEPPTASAACGINRRFEISRGTYRPPTISAMRPSKSGRTSSSEIARRGKLMPTPRLSPPNGEPSRKLVGTLAPSAIFTRRADIPRPSALKWIARCKRAAPMSARSGKPSNSGWEPAAF